MFLGVEHAPSSRVADTMHGVMNFMLIIFGLSDRFDVNGVY